MHRTKVCTRRPGEAWRPLIAMPGRMSTLRKSAVSFTL